jgi:hypothetical protein
MDHRKFSSSVNNETSLAVSGRVNIRTCRMFPVRKVCAELLERPMYIKFVVLAVSGLVVTVCVSPPFMYNDEEVDVNVHAYVLR